MLKTIVDYPTAEQEQSILERYQNGFRAADLETAHLQPIITSQTLPGLRAAVEKVSVAPAVQRYITNIVRTTRTNRHVTLGPSPRAAVTLMLAAKAMAAMRDRDFVTPDDIKTLSAPAFR